MGEEEPKGAYFKVQNAVLSSKKKITSDGLFVGTACSVALVSYTHYTPTLAQTTPSDLSFSDMACILGTITAIVLLILSRHNRPAFARPLVIPPPRPPFLYS